VIGPLAKEKPGPPEEINTEPVKPHYIVGRGDFLEKVNTAYAHYAA
jgi:hypothetical protein